MNEVSQYKEFWDFVSWLNQNQIEEHLILVGSWAEYIYAQFGILPGFDVNLRTLDIDFLIRNKNRPGKAVNIISTAQQAGYLIDYDRMEGTTKFYIPGSLEIEFIIEQRGSGKDTIIDTNLGVSAQALRHIGMLKDNIITISHYDNTLTVPTPEAYTIHKIIINDERRRKAHKDKQAILNLIGFLNENKFKEIYEKLTVKEKKIVRQFLKDNWKGWAESGFTIGW
jgi:hypothetical protein